MDFPGGSEVKSVCLQCGRPGFDPWVRKIPWRRKWHPTPVFLPRESHGQRSLVGYSPRVTKSRTRLSDFTNRCFSLLILSLDAIYTVHGILQARILEWVAFPFSRGSSQLRDQTQVSRIAADSLPAETPGKRKRFFFF